MLRLLRLHTVPAEGESATWLELFFDLIYVAILYQWRFTRPTRKTT